MKTRLLSPGSVSHGTLRAEDILPRFISVLFETDPSRARGFWNSNVEFLTALCDKEAGVKNPWWESEAASWTAEELTDILEEYVPEGFFFGAHPGDGSDFGVWPIELA